MKQVQVWTDGSCYYKTGYGGAAAILRSGKYEREISLGLRQTTTGRAEIHGAILALSLLREPCAITLTSDSRYVVDTLNFNALRLAAWERRDWRRSSHTRPERQNASKGVPERGKQAFQRPPSARIANVDLWRRVATALKRHAITAVWVRGHSGHAENERCDVLAGIAYANGPWTLDAVEII